mgnify:CR=1 FL=1
MKLGSKVWNVKVILELQLGLHDVFSKNISVNLFPRIRESNLLDAEVELMTEKIMRKTRENFSKDQMFSSYS